MSNDPVQNPYTSPSTPGSITPTVQGPTTIRESTRINQIICLSLIAGITVITGILLSMVIPKAEDISDLLVINEESYVFLGIGYGITIICAIASVVMRRLTKQAAARAFLASDPNVSLPIPVDKEFPGNRTILGGLATANIIGAALFEGPAVVNAVFMLIGNNLWHLIPIAFAIFGILLTLPTVTKTKYFIEDVVSRSAA